MINPTIDQYGVQRWCEGDELHRIGGPAVIFASGTQGWFVKGKCHRIDGPACVDYDGTHHWYVDGVFCYNTAQFQKAAKLSNEEMSFLLLKYKFK
jgi:hypothetical protein